MLRHLGHIGRTLTKGSYDYMGGGGGGGGFGEACAPTPNNLENWGDKESVNHSRNKLIAVIYFSQSSTQTPRVIPRCRGLPQQPMRNFRPVDAGCNKLDG